MRLAARRSARLTLLASLCLSFSNAAGQTGVSSPAPLAGVRSIGVRVSYAGSRGTPLPDIQQLLRYDGAGFISSRVESLTAVNRRADLTLMVTLSLRQYPPEHPEPVARVLLSYARVEGRAERSGSSGPVLWMSQPGTDWLSDPADFNRLARRAIERHLNAFLDAWYAANRPPPR